MHKQALVDGAKRKNIIETGKTAEATATSHMNLDGRKIEVPSLLTTFCNMVELMRLRHEIILAASECCILQQIYM